MTVSTMQIFVKPYFGETITLNVRPTTTISDIAKMLHIGTERKQQPCHNTIEYGGKPLSNKQFTLQDYGVHNLSTLISTNIKK